VIAAQGTTATLSALVRNGAGQPTAAPDLTLTVYDPAAGVELTVAIPTIVVDGVGLYHYDWVLDANEPLGAYTATWQGTVGGQPVTGNETIEVVPAGSIFTDPVTFIDAGDYASIRFLLGVEEIDLRDDVIVSLAFAQHAELRVKTVFPTWHDLVVNSLPWKYLKTATAYATAALIAESYAKGGMIGLARGQGVGVRAFADWDKLSATLWSYFPKLIEDAQAIKDGVQPVIEPSTYDFRLVHIGGSAHAAELRNQARTPYQSWWIGGPAYEPGGGFAR
jgi:hypothetical protein